MTGQPNGRLLVLLLVMVAATLGIVGPLAAILGVRINTTDSLPKGLYLITGEAKAPLVEFCPEGVFSTLSRVRGYRPTGACPDGGAPLLKPVIANVGDTVELSGVGIRVNGRLLPNTAPHTFDSDGRLLAPWPSGIYPVPAGTLWVASTYHANSFDSRYFGPISTGQVRHHMRPLWVLHPSATGH
jgi:conjugative transfer signal peptidase TraF